jgi:hypothetical protein
MGLWPTYSDESPFLRFIDSKQVIRDFRTECYGLISSVMPGTLDLETRGSSGRT